ncbi:hypothetical protein ACOMHN_064962 [Nucella lapillus]
MEVFLTLPAINNEMSSTGVYSPSKCDEFRAVKGPGIRPEAFLSIVTGPDCLSQAAVLAARRTDRPVPVHPSPDGHIGHTGVFHLSGHCPDSKTTRIPCSLGKVGMSSFSD